MDSRKIRHKKLSKAFDKFYAEAQKLTNNSTDEDIQISLIIKGTKHIIAQKSKDPKI